MVFSVLLGNNTRRAKRGVNYAPSYTLKQFVNLLPPCLIHEANKRDLYPIDLVGCFLERNLNRNYCIPFMGKDNMSLCSIVQNFVAVDAL